MDEHEFIRVQNLPDYPSCELIEAEFKKLVIKTHEAYIEDKGFLLKAYYELSERQWHTYKLLDLNLLKQIDLILITLWNKESLEDTEAILGAIGMLGLTNTFNLIKASLSLELPKEVKLEILEAVEEFGDTVENPYSDD